MADPTTADLRAAVRSVAAGAASDLMAAGEKLAAGDLNLSAFVLGTRATIKAAHLGATAAAAGGFASLTASQIGSLGAKLKGLYGALTDLEFQYRSDQISAAMLAARVATLARGAMGTFENAVRTQAKDSGATEERRLIESLDPCEDCQSYADQGWQPIGSLPGVGESCSCGNNCKCEFEYR